MTSKELNLKLLKLLPEIEKLYKDEVSWQEGDETGSHTVFSDVLFPYILDHLEDVETTKRVFDVIEKILELHDEYADEVIALSVLENLFYEQERIDKFEKYLGVLSKHIFSQFKL